MSDSAIQFYSERTTVRSEPWLARSIVIGLTMLFLTVFVVLPLVIVFAQAFSKGVSAYLAALAEPEDRKSVV